MLANSRDWRSLCYLIGLPVLVIYQWNQADFSYLAYTLEMILAVGVCCINHNHGHLPLWKNTILNRLTDYWICLLQGVPVFLFEAVHVKSHHRYNQGPQDVTRVLRFGKHNHLMGYLLFPLHTLGPISEVKGQFLNQVKRESFGRYSLMIGQYVALFILWITVFAFNWKKALLFVIVPHIISIHFLLASNYLQHAGVEVGSEFNHSRNFIGFMNVICFNVGYHTAHHESERLHWTDLPSAHEKIASKIKEELKERSFIVYFLHRLTLIPAKRFLGRHDVASKM